ncbi:MAG: riboflavin synthase [Flavobacteriaceae bacterium]|nr:riboflavin synthase [Flavobacteriaceae bacterium]
MFTGIIEEIARVKKIIPEKNNIHIEMETSLASELSIDQSVAHNGVCLTVVSCTDTSYVVTAIQETLDKTNLSDLEKDSIVNIERAMVLGARLDGHIVQGHVDQVGTCVDVKEEEGSWIFTFQYDPSLGNVTIEKGSITINGVSLTVVNSKKGKFSVAIIPYTYEHTTFNTFKIGTKVNLEFDVIGKYVKRLTQGY